MQHSDQRYGRKKDPGTRLGSKGSKYFESDVFSIYHLPLARFAGFADFGKSLSIQKTPCSKSRSSWVLQDSKGSLSLVAADNLHVNSSEGWEHTEKPRSKDN